MVWTDGIDWQFTEAGCLASATFQPCLGERDFSMRVFDFVHHYIRFSALYQFQNKKKKKKKPETGREHA